MPITSGQPTGLAEQVRAAKRLFGLRLQAFWEEEFYFFPQLPQLLSSSGFRQAGLFFQWTWHTPEVPFEHDALILWEGIDGTRLPALPRNELNLHQWPEDFGPLLASPLLQEITRPVILQWVELMPSRDWMCRSELLLPKLHELLAQESMEIVPGTMSEVVNGLLEHQQAADYETPARAYGPDDVWHGMTLGKNGDRHPRRCREVERLILAAEWISATAGLFGRPYASWDVSPTWELDEAWRELLAAQHHDNHECEGLCGFVGYHQLDKAESLAMQVLMRTQQHIAARTVSHDRRGVRFNPNLAAARHGLDAEGRESQVPPGGYAVVSSWPSPAGHTTVDFQRDALTLRRDDLAVTIDRERGIIRQITTAASPGGVLDPDARPGLLDLRVCLDGTEERFERVELELGYVAEQDDEPCAIIGPRDRHQCARARLESPPSSAG